MKKNQKTARRTFPGFSFSPVFRPAALIFSGLQAWGAQALAVEIEPLGKALSTILGSTKVSKKNVTVDGKPVGVFLAKDAAGKVSRAAFVEKGVYEPDCTHTWAVGIDPENGSVTEVRMVEMKCPHAFPTKAGSFLDQFKGKGPADAEKLVENTDVIAKATGSSKLAAEAVKRSIEAFKVAKGQL